MVERYSSQGKFPSERFTIGRVSRTQLLAEPYAPKRSAVNAVDINAQQAAADQLTDTSFTLAWDSAHQYPTDWTIPAGAFSYQGQTAMQVIARLAEAIGAVVKAGPRQRCPERDPALPGRALGLGHRSDGADHPRADRRRMGQRMEPAAGLKQLLRQRHHLWRGGVRAPRRYRRR